METKVIALEGARQVEDFFDPMHGDVDNAFEEASEWVPSERWLRSELRLWLDNAEIPVWRSRQFRVTFVQFVEFDSNNISHAGAIYEFLAEGPKHIVDRLEQYLTE